MDHPLLVVCCGLPGVGKSTVSAYIAEHLPAVRYRSDELRQELVAEPTYDRAETRRTYDELRERARERLDTGESVVLDGTFKRAGERDRTAQLGETTGATVQFVRVTCPPAVARERIRRRTDDASEADIAVYEQLREAFDPLDREHVTIDNGGDLADTYRQVDDKLVG